MKPLPEGPQVYDPETGEFTPWPPEAKKETKQCES
jgi:hypothetical protein